eukprot:11529296-Alexandrium_andersonii.AAC.1
MAVSADPVAGAAAPRGVTAAGGGEAATGPGEAGPSAEAGSSEGVTAAPGSACLQPLAVALPAEPVLPIRESYEQRVLGRMRDPPSYAQRRQQLSRREDTPARHSASGAPDA